MMFCDIAGVVSVVLTAVAAVVVVVIVAIGVVICCCKLMPVAVSNCRFSFSCCIFFLFLIREASLLSLVENVSHTTGSCSSGSWKIVFKSMTFFF